MIVTTLEMEGLIVIEPNVYFDNRGFFLESFKKSNYEKQGVNTNFFQDNLSVSNKGVLRGLHFQSPPFAQGKLVQVLKGAVLDVVVDLRISSRSYGKYFSIILDDKNKKQLYIPEGFAHGFLTLEDNTIFSYKCTSEYNKESEDSILWNDESLAINWNIENPIVSDKDNEAQLFENLKSPFK